MQREKLTKTYDDFKLKIPFDLDGLYKNILALERLGKKSRVSSVPPPATYSYR